MNIHRTLVAAAVFAATVAGAAHADGLKPAQGRSIELGAVSGTAHYIVERDGDFRVVATLAQPEAGATPLRVEMVLAPGQSMLLSTPHGVGVAPEAVEISRRTDDTVLVRRIDDTVPVRKATAMLTN